MNCFKCIYFPCMRKECELRQGQCEIGKSLVSQIIQEGDRDESNQRRKNKN